MPTVQEALAGIIAERQKAKKATELGPDGPTTGVAPSVWDYLPAQEKAARVKKQKAQAAIDTGEDPRVTKFLDQGNSGSVLDSYLTPIQKKLKDEKRTADFFTSNPDLDPRVQADIAASTVKVKDKTVPAEQIVQDTLRIVTAPDTNALTKAAAVQKYRSIRDQLTPALRAKYGLDEYEKSLLAGQKSFKDQTLGAVSDVVSTPGIKQVLGGLDRGRAVVAAGSKQAAIGLDQVLQNKDPRSLSWSEFKGDVNKHIGFGEAYTDLQRAESLANKEKGGTGEVTTFGSKALGATTDAEGKLTYNSGAGLNVARAVGVGGDIFGDPMTYTGTSATKLAKSGLKTLEKEGLEDVARLIEKKGWSALDDATKAEVERVLTATKDPLAKSVQKLGAEGLTAKQIEDIAKGGRKGLHVAGHTVLPFSPGGAGAAGESVTSRYANKIATSDIQEGDKISRLLGTAESPATVRSYDHSAGLLTIEPGAEPIAVTRKGGPVIAGPGTFKVGDDLMDGNAKITHIGDDGHLTLKLDNQLESIERPFDIIPRHKNDVGGQGTLMQVDQVPAPPPVHQQGNLLSSQNEVPILDGVPRIAQDSFDTEAADNLLRVADHTAPKAVDDVVQAGDQFIYRNADGKAAGILSIADGKVETLFVDPALRGQGISNRLYQAADEAGIDVSKLGADELTPAGETARASYLKSKGELPGRVDTATTYRRTKDGGVTQTRVFRQRDGEYVLKDGEFIVEPVEPPRNLANSAEAGAKADVHAANSGIEVGTVVGRTPDGNLLLKPAMGEIQNTQIGEHVPGLFGTLEEIRPDGTWVIKPDPTLFKGGQALPEVAGAVSPAEAAAPVSAPTTPPDVSGEQGSLFPTASAPVSTGESPLPNIDPYGPRPTVPKDVAREKLGGPVKVTTAEPEAQQKLFDLGIVPTRDLKEGDRIRGLGGVVVENQGKRIIKAKLDDGTIQVIRADELMRIDAKDAIKGDIFTDSGMSVVSRNADGTVTLKGAPPLGVQRIVEDTTFGGLKAKPALRDKIPGIRTARDMFAPRASVEAAGREGRVGASAGRDLYAVQSGERAALGNTLNDMQLRLRSVEARLRKGLGRDEALQTLKDAFDVGSGEGSKAQSLADSFREEAKTAVAGRAKQLNQAASALETMIDIRREISAVEDKIAGRSIVAGAGEQGTLGLEGLPGLKNAKANPLEPDQMPGILTKQGKKALALQPNLKDALSIDRQLEHLSQGFDYSSRAGRNVLRIEDPALASSLGKDGSFIEVALDRPWQEVNAQIAETLNEDTRRALKLGDDKPFKMFEENPLTSYSFRNRTAQTVAVEQDMMAQAEKAGLVRRGVLPKAEDAAAQGAHAEYLKNLPGNYVEVQGWGTPGEIIHADPAVAKEMSKVRAILHNDEELKAWKRTVNQASALWTRQVLSPITKGFGQQMRNLQTNIINATFGGLTLDGQKEAIRLQAGHLREAGKLMKTEGLTFDKALEKLGLEAGGRDATLLKYLREDDILNTGLYRTLDWGDTAEQKALGGAKEFAKRRINPLSSRNALFAPGKVVNTAIEDNGRMALYISVFDKTGSRDAAREAVHKYLFDYSDLTTFESHVMKNVNAFYTFMRKNTGLQLAVFAERPALPLTVLKAKAALADKGDKSLLAPGEQQDRGLFQAGGALQSVIGGKGVVGIDDPVTAAIRTIDPFIQNAYYLADKASGGKLLANLPPTEKPTGASIAKGYIGLTAGAPAEALTTLAEVALGKDLRTDRDLKESDTWKKFVSAVAPVWDQGRTVEGMATGDKPLRTNLLRMFAGISAYRRDTDAAQYSLNYAMLNELDQTIKLLQAQGVDVPTMSDLQDAGLIPTASEIKKARTVPLTPEMKKAEARKKLGLPPTP